MLPAGASPAGVIICGAMAYIFAMRKILAATWLVLAGLAPLAAQAQEGGAAPPAEGVPDTAPDAPDAPAAPEDGLSLMEQGLRLFMKGMQKEIEPAMRDLESALRELQPALLELLRLVDDFTNYHPPEILPNGDIIIRRKRPDEMAAPGEGEIEI